MASTAETLAEIAAEAGTVVMRHYKTGSQPRFKSDRSPVTDADEEAEQVILSALFKAFPGVPVVAEEEAAAGRVAKIESRFFLVDPLDGTKEFISCNGEFTVNIAEVQNGVPVAGAVFAPAMDRMFFGGADGAFENGKTIAARVAPKDGLVAVGSRSHADAATGEFLKRWTVKDSVRIGSSLKFCLVAAGEADIYARGGPTMEWDTAAGDAVLRAAGGSMETWNGETFRYGKPGFQNAAFVAYGKRS